jgi:outer membrane protein, heavy metal efflux system
MKRLPLLFLLFWPFLSFPQTKLSVIDAIKMGRSNNPYSKLYKLNLDIEKSELITSGLRPNLLFNQQSIFITKQANLDLIKENQTLFLSPYGDQLWFQVTKQFQINGKRQSKIDFQNTKINFSEKDIVQYTNDMAYNTALRWLEVWYAKIKLEILNDAKSNVDTLLAINKIRLRNQVITSTDLARNQMISDQYNTQLNAAEQVLISESQKLAYMTGMAEVDDIDMGSDFFYIDITDTLDKLNDMALMLRPDYQSNLAYNKVLKSNIDLQKSLSIPNLEFGLVANPQNTQLYVGWYFQVPIPVFDRNQGSIQKSKVQHEQNTAKGNVMKKQMETEISYTFQEYETHRENSESYRLIVENADNILKTVRFSYLRGGTTIVDYLLAQQNWFEVQKAYYETLYLYRKSYLNVLYTTGILTKE